MPMTRRALMIVLGLALVASIAGNVVLLRRGRALYRDLLLARVEPPVATRYEGENRKLAAPAAGETRVVLLGDSRVKAWRPGPGGDGIEIVNRGHGGDTTTALLARHRRDALDLDPHVLVLQAGINDLKAIGVAPERADRIVAVCATNLRRIVEAARDEGVVVVVLPVLPPGPIELARRLVWSPRIETAVAEVNDALADLAAPGVLVVDCGPLAGADGRLRPAYARDALHLNEAGYAALDGIVRPVLADLAGRSTE
ncbi:MAG: SGNH/GDSL hydrolase family protein [Planctomycetota bacterium]|jgi:lysophospholipase L1-like esterase